MTPAAYQYIIDKLKDHHESDIAYDTFSDVVSGVGLHFNLSSEVASKIVQEILQERNIEVKTQEATRGEMYPAKEQAVPWGKGNPGDLAEPKSSLKPLSSAELSHKTERTNNDRLQPGDYVGVKEDTWRAPFQGVLKKVNDDGTLDVKDPLSGWLYEGIPDKLVTKPAAEGRPVAPPQSRRIGDDYGMMDGGADVGGKDGTREYPGLFHIPRGHEQQYVVNPPSIYDLRKEASRQDLFYSQLMKDLVKKYGNKMAAHAHLHMKGNLQDPSKDVIAALQSYGLIL